MQPDTRLREIARKKRLFRLSEAVAAGVHPEYVGRLTRQGELTRVGRGLYTLATAEATEHHTLAEVSKRVPKARYLRSVSDNPSSPTTLARTRAWVARAYAA